MKISSKFDPNSSCILFPGDCFDLVKQIPDKSVKLVVTSPPYNLGKAYEKRSSLDRYLSLQKEIIKESVRILRDDGSICWQVGNYVNNGEIVPLDIVLYPIFASLGLHLRNRIVWEFGHGLHASKRFSGRYEVILWFTKTNEYTFNLDPIRVPQKYPQKKYFKGPKKGQLSGNPLGKNPSDIWDIPNVKANHIEKTIHPCQFPIELIERLVLSMTNENDWIFDPFMGVGSTAIAALMHNRKVIGSETMEEYVTIAIDRIQKASKGELQMRPIERPVYDPYQPVKNIPPKTIKIQKETQPTLMERHGKYKVEKRK
ncbi:MAG TPA: site-specific DNA-methyltransferase [Anaerolineales bacterium]|nr:site-specific DNA-methyltransferase [Anaerolineales bacterium]HUM26475.1 site-specific DNA-methyltransferase [Anaerolineales bacterium]